MSAGPLFSQMERPPGWEDDLHDPLRAAARATAERGALAKREWFAGSGRWQYRPIHRSLATP